MHKKQMFWLSFLATVGVFTATTSVNAQTNQSDTSGQQTTSTPSISIDSTNGNGFATPITTYNPNTGTFSGGGIDTIQFGSSGGSGSGTGFGTGLGSASGSGGGSGSGFGVGTGSGSGSGSGTGTGTGTGLGDGTGVDTGSDSGSSVGLGEPTVPESGSDSGGGGDVDFQNKKDADNSQEITLNEAAEILETNLDDSLETLTAAERAVDVAGGQEEPAGEPGVALTDEPQDGDPRRIVRNNNARRNTLDEDTRRIVRQSSGCGNRCANPDRGIVKARQADIQEVMAAREIVERQLEASKQFIEQVNKIQPEKNIW